MTILTGKKLGEETIRIGELGLDVMHIVYIVTYIL